MRCRPFSHWNLLLGGYFLAIATGIPLQAEPALEIATKRQDWSTVAETAIRLLAKNPEQHALMGQIAEARLHQDDLKACQAWLERWEAKTPEATGPMLALRGQLASASGNTSEARAHWEHSYEITPSPEVARRLSDPSLWEDEERPIFEGFMTRIARDYHFTQALNVAAEVSVRDRDWKQCEAWIGILNELHTQKAMRIAAKFEGLVNARQALAQHDKASASETPGLALAARADFFRSHQLLQLAIEDARLSLLRAPRMVAPRMTLSLCLAARGDAEAAQTLRVVVQNNQALPDETSRLKLAKLDAAVSAKVIEPATFLHRALLLADIGQPFLALDDLEAAGPALAYSAQGWSCRGDCLRIQRNHEGAREAYETSLEKDASLKAAWLGLAKLADQRADQPAAIKRYTWLVEQEPKNESFQESLARAKASLRP